MSKGFTCNICRNTKTINNPERYTLPEGFEGWYHIEIAKRKDFHEFKPEDKSNDLFIYNEIDICPNCAEKIRNSINDYDFAIGLNDSGHSGVLRLISEIFR